MSEGVKPILPPANLGMLGGGQLGRMFAMEARRLGYGVIVLEPSKNSPCAQVADAALEAAYTDQGALTELAQRSSAISYEFENVDATAAQFLEAQGKPVHPSSHALRICQDRLLEKNFLRDAGLAVTPFASVTSLMDLEKAMTTCGLPGILKTVRGGYDGKGQARIDHAEDAAQAFHTLGSGQVPLIYERKVEFVQELSVVAARGQNGQVVAFPACENTHRHHILDITLAPGRFSPAVAKTAREMALAVGRGLSFVGTYCVEMFVTAQGEVLVNEIAPRPHNSGHFSLGGATVSQFELQLRALCGLPLVEPEIPRPCAMLNLVGDGQGDQLSGIEDILSLPGVSLHWYGKQKAPKGRKMGHVTVTAATPQAALEMAEKVRGLLAWEK